MSDTQYSGFMSNAYAYSPTNNPTTTAQDILSKVGSTVGGSIGSVITPPGWNAVGSMIGEKTGETAGASLGFMIDNRQEIANNVQTFLVEINDWRSWANTMVPSRWY